jgi:hypothetical protein
MESEVGRYCGQSVNMGDYRNRYAGVLSSASQLYAELSQDLDLGRGGFGWWFGHMKQPAVIFASDYLLSTAEQVGRCIEHAAWHESVFAQSWYPEARWFREQMAGPPEARGSRSELDVNRHARIEAALVGFFQSCGSALDSLAALVIGVLGVKTDLVRASWPALARDVAGSDRLLEGPGAGRGVQDEALEAILRAAASEPSGWLGWTLDTRNLMVHRAKRIEIRHFYRPRVRGSTIEYVLLLPRNPQLTEMEAFVLGPGIENLVMREHAGELMSGVLSRLESLVSNVLAVLTQVWEQRRSEPDLIRQPAAQWKLLYPKQRDLSGFSGFDPTIPALGGEMQAAPVMARRFQAAKVLDGDRAFWEAALGR